MGDTLYAAAVSVVNGDGITLAALTVCVPTSRMTPARRETIVPDLLSAGARLSDLVRWLPAFTGGPKLVDAGRL